MESTIQVVAPIYTSLKEFEKSCYTLFQINKCKIFCSILLLLLNYNNKNDYWLVKTPLYGTHYAQVPQKFDNKNIRVRNYMLYQINK